MTLTGRIVGGAETEPLSRGHALNAVEGGLSEAGDPGGLGALPFDHKEPVIVQRQTRVAEHICRWWCGVPCPSGWRDDRQLVLPAVRAPGDVR